MAEYLKYLHQLLALSGESFEEELLRLVRMILERKLVFIHIIFVKCQNQFFTTFPSLQGFSTSHLGPMEVLLAIIKAQRCLKCKFTREEFISGEIGRLMEPDDFISESSVSCNYIHTHQSMLP